MGEELVLMGVPKEDIILGLHPPYKRPYTGYGVAGEEVKLTENRL
ncbi:MAG: element excision factor XisI family protein [Microcoleaceae cyanobacterium]